MPPFSHRNSKLRSIDVSHNNLKYLPATMKQMPSLQELSVEDAFVEDSLLCLPKLRIATLKELSCSSISIRIPWF